MFPRAPHFASKPTSGQFAKNGVWEDAWSFTADGLPDTASVDAYLGESTEVAFEAFFGDAFFGVRMAGSPSVIRAFADHCLQAMRAANQGEFLVEALGGLLQCGPLGEHLAFAEVGAVNAWRSVGAFRIDMPCIAGHARDSVWAALQRSPVGHDAQHPKAIEFACEHPLPHWFGIPVSAWQAPYTLSLEMLNDALDLIGDQRVARL